VILLALTLVQATFLILSKPSEFTPFIMTILQTLGVVSCLGGPLRSCGYAAEMLRDEFARQSPQQKRLQLQWHLLFPENHGSKEEKLAKLNQSISQFTQYLTKANQPFLVIGGDHSCALGTWGGVLNGLQQPDKFGLIWLDAHMDAHTFDTSPSGNIHGMPVSALIGRADKKLATMYPGSDFIKPENFILLGVRNYENEEYDLLKRAAVKIVFANEINEFAQVLINAINKLSLSCQTIGISIDLDFIDPADAPGVETPAQGGIKAEELIQALALINRHPKICGLEISEFNPEKDSKNKTLHLMKEIIEAFYGEPQ
jgi:arginase